MERTDKKVAYRILYTICRYYDLTEQQVCGRCRKRELVDARHKYCYFTKQMTKLSLTEIGRIINRDHATVTYARNNVSFLRKFYGEYNNQLEHLEDVIRHNIVFDVNKKVRRRKFKQVNHHVYAPNIY